MAAYCRYRDGARAHSVQYPHVQKYRVHAMAVKPGFPASLPGNFPAGFSAAPRRTPSVALAQRQPVQVPETRRLVERPQGDDWALAHRRRLMEKLQEREVLDPRVIQAMAAVPRHLFVDSALAAQAYEDTSLPIGLGQTISKPSVVARMLSLLVQEGPSPLGRVLEIGSGCGYQAAVLARLAKEVYSVERLRQLHEKARSNVRPLLIGNLHLLLGDGMLGFPKGAPYDAIISAAGGDNVPQAWVDQLAPGACIIAPTVQAASGRATASQCLLLIRKTPQGLVSTAFESVQFVPLKSGIA